jgi:hypothetical protein
MGSSEIIVFFYKTISTTKPPAGLKSISKPTDCFTIESKGVSSHCLTSNLIAWLHLQYQPGFPITLGWKSTHKDIIGNTFQTQTNHSQLKRIRNSFLADWSRNNRAGTPVLNLTAAYQTNGACDRLTFPEKRPADDRANPAWLVQLTETST